MIFHNRVVKVAPLTILEINSLLIPSANAELISLKVAQDYTTSYDRSLFKHWIDANKNAGFALPSAINKGGATKLAPEISKKLYEANKKSDRDKGGVACEK